MGILDDTIREHLELKRARGTEDDELKRLEDEAFGPPTRPDEPDFPERPPTGEEAAAAMPANGGGEAATAMVQPPTAEEHEPHDEPAAGEHAVVEPGAAEPAEAAFYDHASDQDPEPAAEPHGSGSSEAPAKPEAQVEPSDDELALELDLDLDEEDEAEEDEPPPASDVPIELHDTVEHDFEGAIDEQPPGSAPATGQPQESEPGGEQAPAEGEAGEHDVLEETPEFLRDQPEDDELWFEQGKPKDFDF